MPTPLNLTYILPYNCPRFARMRNSFTSVDLSTVDLSTCLPVNLSIYQPVDLSPVTWLYMEFAFYCGGLGGLPPGIPLGINVCTHAQFFHFRRPVNLSSCRPVTCNMAIYGVCILLWIKAYSIELDLHPSLWLPKFERMRNSFISVDLSTVDLSTCQPVDLSSCRPVTCNMAIYGVCILLQGLGGLYPRHSVVNQSLLHWTWPTSFPMIANVCTHAQFFHFRRPQLSTCRTINLSTCHLVDLSPVTWLYMEFAFFCGGLGGGGGGLAPQAFRCESMPTPLNLTYILPYDCPCFARMRNSFTSVDLSAVDLSTCRPVHLSTCQPVNLSTCQHFVGYYLCAIHLRCVISSYYSLRLVFTSNT